MVNKARAANIATLADRCKFEYDKLDVCVFKDNLPWIYSEHLLIRLHIHAVSDAADCPKCKTRARPGRAVISYPKSDFGDPIF